jgi:hypothetical protein
VNCAVAKSRRRSGDDRSQESPQCLSTSLLSNQCALTLGIEDVQRAVAEAWLPEGVPQRVDRRVPPDA